MPYRIDLLGGWLDQPFVSKHHPGGIITLSIEPTLEFYERSGMASSTRRSALDLWGPRLPAGNPAKLSKMLFCYDNPPGTKEISGAQDSIGIVYPRLAYSVHDGDYWPAQIDHVADEDALRFVENLIYLVPLGPRHSGYNILGQTYIDGQRAQRLADAAEACWQAILNRDSATHSAPYSLSCATKTDSGLLETNRPWPLCRLFLRNLDYYCSVHELT